MNKLAAKQKKIIAICLVAVFVLSIITFASDPNFSYNSPQISNTEQQAKFKKKLAEQRAEYEAYLKSVNADPVASKLLFEKVIDEQDVRKMVEDELGVTQTVTIPKVTDNRIRVTDKVGQKPIEDYMVKIAEGDSKLAESSRDAVRNMYLASANLSDLGNSIGTVEKYTNQLSSMEVGKELVGFHRATLGVYDSLSRQLALAQNFQTSAGSELYSKEFYRELVISEYELKKMNSEYAGMKEKYPSLPSPDKLYAHTDDWFNPLISLGLIHKAEAFFGLGQFFIELLKDAVAAAAGAVMSRVMSFLIDKIEKVMAIVNYAYYWDAVANKYINDALDKYVEDPINKALAKKFVTSMNCGKVDSAGIHELAKQQAAEYLGFDPEAGLDLSSVDLYLQINKAGQTQSSADGQKLIAKDAAQSAEAIGEKATDAELKSEGKKVGLSATAGRAQIKLTLGAIQGTQTAGLIALLTGAAPSFRSVTGFITALVQSLVKAVVNNFLFKDSTVKLKEQDRQACLTGVTQVDPIVPSTFITESTNVTVNQDFINLCGSEVYDDLCVNGIIPPVIDNNSETDSAELNLDKAVYKVGEVPKYTIKGAEPNQVIYFVTDTNPRSTPDDELVWKSYERDSEVLTTDGEGNWPAAGSQPWGEPWGCADKGTFIRLVKIGSKIYQRGYKVEDNPGDPCL